MQKNQDMHQILSRLDKIENKLITYRGKCIPTEDDAFYCAWDRFYAMASVFASAMTVSLLAVTAKGTLKANEFRHYAEKEYNKICMGNGHFANEFSAFLAQGQSTHICSDLMRRKEDAMQGLIQWLYSGVKYGAGLGITGIITKMNGGITYYASILRKAHCRRIGHNDARYCTTIGVPLKDAFTR